MVGSYTILFVMMADSSQRTGVVSEAVLRVESEFFEQAVTLQLQFANKAAAPVSFGAANCLFSYVYYPNAFQCLTVNAEQVFSQELVFDLLNGLRAWARENLRAQHASTPCVRIYVNGCARRVIRDDVNAKWHYLLCLTRLSGRTSAKVSVVVDSVSGDLRDKLTLGASRVLTTKLDFNELLVHDVSQPYGIKVSNVSADPAEGVVFLDGYIW
jgi:hypothetical protein